MSVRPIRRPVWWKVGVTAVTAAVMLLAAAPAQAHTPTRAAAHRPNTTAGPHRPPAPGRHHPGKPPKKPVVVRFSADGLVVAHTASSVTVLAHTLRVGNTVRHNQLLTTHAAAGHRYAAAVTASGSTSDANAVIGDQMIISGTVAGSGTTAVFTADSQEQHATSGHAYLGTVQAVNGALVTVIKSRQASDDTEEDHNGQGSFTVDVSAAAIQVDGQPGALTPGQTVVVLGEGDHDTVVAAAVYAYTTVPAVIAGEVTAVTGSTLTIGGQDNPSTVDLGAATLIIDGQPAATADALATADTALILGTTDTAGTFTATTAFIFTTHDTHPLPPGDHNNDGNNNDGNDG